MERSEYFATILGHEISSLRLAMDGLKFYKSSVYVDKWKIELSNYRERI